MKNSLVCVLALLATLSLFAGPAVVSGPALAADSVAASSAIDDPVSTDPIAPDPVLVVVDSDGVTNAIAKTMAEVASNAVAKAALDAEARGVEEARQAELEATLARRRISTRIFRLTHANGEEIAERFNETWSGDFGTGWKVAKIASYFPESNAVMVTAPAMILDACQKVIDEIDQEAQQVYIEARFVELSNNASHKLGIDWQMLDGMKGSMSLDAGFNERKLKGVSTYNSDGSYTMSTTDADGAPSKANLSYVNATIGMSELYVILRALESNEDARTFSNPKIIVSSGKKATVDMTTKYPNVQVAAKKTFNTSGTSTDLDMKMAEIPGEDKMMFAKESFFSWGISLEVTPRINTNGLINVQIVPTISDCSQFVTAGGDSKQSKEETVYTAKYPIINVQRLITEFNMESESTAVIGGLSRTIETQKDNGIPFLRDIWWIGPRLFGSKIRVKEQKEIIVFVTVGLVNPRHIRPDAGLPKNAVLGRQYTSGLKLEPGDKPPRNLEGIGSLDLRPLEVQAEDPLATNKVENVSVFDRYLPFRKE